MRLREKLIHYTNDLGDVDLKQEAIATIEHIAQCMDEDELLHHSRPLALAYLALTEDASVPVVHGRWINGRCSKDIGAIPIVDAVVVTRCMDCKHLVAVNVNGKGISTCRVSGMKVAQNEFCSRGEKERR